MAGNIYTDQLCPICKGKMVHDENRRGCFCRRPEHSKIRATEGFRVTIKYHGKLTRKRFPSYELAYQELAGWRYEIIQGTFDPRDHQADHPLSFRNQSEAWLQIKKYEVCASHHANLSRYIFQAREAFGSRNVKSIGYGDIEDFLHSLTVSDKTKHDTVSCLAQFFKWLERREGVKAPDMPSVKFKLGWREIIDIETQQAIIDQVKEIAPFKVWLGIKWMATYVAARPKEFWSLRERDINVNGYLVFPPGITKTEDPVIVPMLDEDIALYKEIPQGIPDLHFFRWDPDHPRTPGKRYGKNLFYQWWMRACEDLKITGVDLYGGTRHSTVTAMGEHFTEDEVKNNATMHRTTKAFDRYFQKKTAPTKNIYQAMQSKRETGKIISVEFPKSSHGDDK